MAVKIAVTGTHGVGKTVLIQSVKASLPTDVLEHIKFPPELAIDIIKSLGFRWQDVNKDTYKNFEKCLFNYYCLVSKLDINFLADRLPIDVIAYWTYILREPIPDDMLRDLVKSIKQYDTIYFYKEDNLDSERGFIQQEIENWLIKMYHLADVPYFVFYRKDFDEIVDEIVDTFVEKLGG